jgi:hypothetical protein
VDLSAPQRSRSTVAPSESSSNPATPKYPDITHAPAAEPLPPSHTRTGSYPDVAPDPTRPADPPTQTANLLERLRSPNVRLEAYLQGLAYDVHVLRDLAADPACRHVLYEVRLNVSCPGVLLALWVRCIHLCMHACLHPCCYVNILTHSSLCALTQPDPH